MLEINLRTFANSSRQGLFGDYKYHEMLIHSELRKKVEAYIDSENCMPIYQYYSATPGCVMEAKMLHRMKLGMCFTYLEQSPEQYVSNLKLPEVIKHLLIKYLMSFLKEMDYIVVANYEVEEELRKSGMEDSEIYWIGDTGQYAKEIQALVWMELYRKASEQLILMQETEKKKHNTFTEIKGEVA